jgi:rare lipoprotein A
MVSFFQLFFLIVFFLTTLLSCSTSPKGNFYQQGTASWYGEKFHGRTTASGEKYNMYEMTAAHKTLPFGTMVIVKSKTSSLMVQVRITDRGPFVSGRIIDLSYAAAKKLNIIQKGEDKVELYLSAETN